MPRMWVIDPTGVDVGNNTVLMNAIDGMYHCYGAFPDNNIKASASVYITVHSKYFVLFKSITL